MIYQLAKTSTLLTGQVKWDLVMNKDKVTNLQIVPISEHIPYNYNAPVDVMNYSHGDNVKQLYHKIQGDFYSAKVNPNLSVEHLHRSKDLYQDTHENTYEMGMKRMEFHRYSKQFSFFCPFWCDNIHEFNDLRFKICIKNAKNPNRVLYSSFIDMSYLNDYMKKYFDDLQVYDIDSRASLKFNDKYYCLKINLPETNLYPNKIIYCNVLDEDDVILVDENNVVWECTQQDLANPDLNTYNFLGIATPVNKLMYMNDELIYLNFTEYRAWVRGINAESGLVQTRDCSQIINNLLSQERPMLELDNMIANTFAQNKLICSQLFNFNFIFNIEDFIPAEFISRMLGEKMNIYVDMYCGNEKVEVRDLYTNYEFIPRYDNYLTKYNLEHNALEYLQDFRVVDLITKNKLVQSTFHWAFKNNPKLLFNLYDGCSPLYNGEEKIHGLVDNATDLYMTKYNDYLNPLGIYSYHYEKDINSTNLSLQMHRILNDDDYFYQYHSDDKNEYQWFGDLRITNKGLEMNKNFSVCFLKINNVDYGQLSEVLKGDSFGFNEYENIPEGLTDKNNKEITHEITYWWNEDSRRFLIVYLKSNENAPVNQIISNNFLYSKFIQLDIQKTDEENPFDNPFAVLQAILKNAQKHNIFMFEKSVTGKHVNSPDINSNEIQYLKTDKVKYIQRYDLNLYPYFIRLDNKNYFNYTYWCKQYINTLNNPANVIDNIENFNKISFSKFAPIFPSLDYFVINKTKLDYNHFYLNRDNVIFQGDVSWYKDNSLFILPSEVNIEHISTQLDDEKVQELLFNYFTKNFDIEQDTSSDFKKMYDVFIQKVYPLYRATYTFDYNTDTDITIYKYKIKYELR